MAGAANHGQGGPDESHQGEPDARSDLLNDKTVRDLTDDVFASLEGRPLNSTRKLTANSETCNQEVVLIAREVDVLFHPGDVSVTQNGAVYTLSVKLSFLIGSLEEIPR